MSFPCIFWIAGGKPKPGGFKQPAPGTRQCPGGLSDRRRRRRDRGRPRRRRADARRRARWTRPCGPPVPQPVPSMPARPRCCWRRPAPRTTSSRISRPAATHSVRWPWPKQVPHDLRPTHRPDSSSATGGGPSTGPCWPASPSWRVVGLVLIFAASPAVGERVYGAEMHFVVKHLIFLIPASALLLGVSLLAPLGVLAALGRDAGGCSALCLLLTLALRARGQRRPPLAAAVRLPAAAQRVRQAGPGRGRGASAGQPARRRRLPGDVALGAGRCSSSWCCSPTSA